MPQASWVILGIVLVLVTSGCSSVQVASRKTLDEVVSDCNQKSGTARWSCISQVAVQLNNPSLCDTISVDDFRLSCRAQALKDPDYCAQINNSVDREACFYLVAVMKKDGAVCDRISPGNRTACIVMLVQITRDTSLCDKLELEVSRTQCLQGKTIIQTVDSTAKEYSDLRECEQETFPTRKDNCYNSIALKAQDISLCEKIGKASKREGCYYLLAKGAKDSILCEKITENTNLKGLCLMHTQ